MQWFELIELPSDSWDNLMLDTLYFILMMEDDALGFVNPADVIQSCHIIPAFAMGKLHPDSVTMSGCAQDGNDWKQYYINR